jgi:hypothetical protein
MLTIVVQEIDTGTSEVECPGRHGTKMILDAPPHVKNLKISQIQAKVVY